MQITDRELFENLLEQLLLTPSGTFVLSGVANASVVTAIGEMVLENVSVSQVITLDGINAFGNFAIKIQEPNNHITAGFDWGFELYLITSILNPAGCGVYMNRLSFDIFFMGTLIGNGTSGNVTLNKGENTMKVIGKYVDPGDADLQRQFISAYLQGNSSLIQLVGNSVNIPLVQNAMSKLNVSVYFPGNQASLLEWAKLHIPPAGNLALYNPIECNVTVSNFSDFTIYKIDWKYFTTAYDAEFDPPLVVTPGDVVVTAPIKLKLTLAEFFSIFEGYLTGNHTLLATGVVGVSIGDFGPLLLDAQQNFTLVGYEV